MTLTAVPDITDGCLDLDLAEQLTCQCEHEEYSCGAPASVRVTAICQLPECRCADWTARACSPCLRSWREIARSRGYRLHVDPLE